MNCPECGSEMVERYGQYGRFMGCSRYPECKGTRSLAKAPDISQFENLPVHLLGVKKPIVPAPQAPRPKPMDVMDFVETLEVMGNYSDCTLAERTRDLIRQRGG